MGGDYYGIRVSCLEQEGPARLNGRVIKGDYLLCVNGASMRGKEVGEALDAISAAPAKCTFEFLDSKARSKYTVVLGRETKGREELFMERLERILAGPFLDMTYLDNLRRSCAQCAKEKEDRPSFVVCGFPGVGKTSLINTILAAINSSDYSVADASTPTMEYTRYEQVLRGADQNPFMIADTVGLTGDDAVFQSLRNVLKGRHKNNRKMDNAWGSKKASADVRKRAHGLILVADVSQKVSGSIVAALDDMCAEDDLPVVVAWTNIRGQPVQSISERVRSMLAQFPRAVNFPVLHYTQGQSNVATVDYTVLAMFHSLRAQSERYMKYGQQEAAVKL
jgi:GTPase SAR1 family protein